MSSFPKTKTLTVLGGPMLNSGRHANKDL